VPISPRALHALLPVVLLVACTQTAKPPPPDDGEVLADAASVDFGPVFVGETAQRVVRVKNRGRAAGALQVRITRPFVATAPTEPLAPGAIVELTVDFTPDGAGSATGALELEIPGVPGSVTVNLTGSGAARTLDRPDVIDAENVEVGKEKELQVTIKNTAPLPQVVAVSVDGPDADAFLLGLRSLALEAGEAKTFPIVARPTSAGTLVAGLRLSPCETCEAISVVLTGKGWVAAVSTDTPTIDFGTVPPGSTASHDVRIQNLSTGAVTITAVSLVAGAGSPFALPGLPELPLSLDPGPLPVTVTFTPDDTGARTATLRIVVAGKVLQVALQGVGGNGGVAITPDALDLGTVAAAVGATRRVSVSDTGAGAAVQIDGVSLEGPGATRFAVKTSRSLPTSLRPITLDIDVSVASAEPGTYDATLVVDVSGSLPRRVPIHATIVSGGYCDLTVEPAAVAFGLQPFDSTTQRQLRLRNDANLECTVGPFEVVGSSAFSVDVDAGQTRLVPARGSIGLSVSYHPARGEGKDDAELRFGQAHATVPSLSIPLSGHGSEPVLAPTPATVDLPAGSIGAEELVAIDLSNVSPVPLRITGQRVTGATDRFSLAQPAPADVPVGGTVTLHVRHKAADTRAAGQVELDVDGAAAPIVVPLAAAASTATCTSCPTPRASCPGAVTTFLQRDQVLTGAASTTVAGGATCAWAIMSAPPGSAAAPPEARCQTVFRADVVGRYELQLTASTKDARTDTCRTTVDVKSATGLWVESRPHEDAVIDQHLFLSSAGPLDQAATWTGADGHAWKRRVRPAWGADGLDDDPIVERGSTGVAGVIRIGAPTLDTAFEVGVHRPASTPKGPVSVDTTIWCAGKPVANVTTQLDTPFEAAHVGTVRFSAANACTFQPGSTTLEVQP
jgi:hypothetical protein